MKKEKIKLTDANLVAVFDPLHRVAMMNLQRYHPHCDEPLKFFLNSVAQFSFGGAGCCAAVPRCRQWKFKFFCQSPISTNIVSTVLCTGVLSQMKMLIFKYIAIINGASICSITVFVINFRSRFTKECQSVLGVGVLISIASNCTFSITLSRPLKTIIPPFCASAPLLLSL